MRRFFTSDHHFSHKNILRYEAVHRPFRSIEEMNQTLISRWNQAVSPQDEVYYLGDLTFDAHSTRAQALLAELNGVKYLVRGNHDPQHLRACGFQWMKSTHELTLVDREGRQDECLKVLMCHYPYIAPEFLHMDAEGLLEFSSLGRTLSEVFKEPVDELLKQQQDYQTQRRFLIEHYGLKLKQSERELPETRALQRFLQRALKRMTWRQPRPQGQWLLHGHVHGRWQSKPHEKMINVSVEAWDLTPVSEQALVEIILSTGV